MYFDVHTHPDYLRMPFTTRAAMDEVDEKIRAELSRWLKRAAILGPAVVLVFVVILRT